MTQSPFDDAVAVWHMADLTDPALHGDAEVGVEREAMSLCIRLRDPSGKWNGTVVSEPGYRLFAADGAVCFELKTDAEDEALRLSVPAEAIGPTDWHDVIVRFTGPRLELFVDDVLVDEEWPIGTIRHGDDQPVPESSFDGRVALWDRALSDDEIVVLSDGPEAVSQREADILGEERQSMQYWRPRGHNTSVGDCMPFFHDGRFHLFYLFDRRSHKSKWSLGAHQWAHASTTDLIHWEHHPMAIPITGQWEGSICTGSAFYHDGNYYGFYATRKPDRTQHLGLAVSADGIHFEKTEPNPFASPVPPYRPGPYRDPTVFRDERTGLFHLLVTAELADPPLAGRGGCLAHLVSSDLKTWEVEEPFIVPGYAGHQPECPDYFEWHGWYYLVSCHACNVV